MIWFLGWFIRLTIGWKLNGRAHVINVVGKLRLGNCISEQLANILLCLLASLGCEIYTPNYFAHGL